MKGLFVKKIMKVIRLDLLNILSRFIEKKESPLANHKDNYTIFQLIQVHKPIVRHLSRKDLLTPSPNPRKL